MQFTVQQLADDLVYVGIFLLIGYVVREMLSPLRKIFLPASIVGGAIALILGPQVLGIVEVPKSLALMMTPMTNIIFVCLCWGFSISREKIRAYADFVFANGALMYAQIAVACSLGVLFMKFWPGLPAGWGLTLPVGFMIGHSVIPAIGGALEAMGSEGVIDIGMVFATIGLLVGVIVGTFISNIGIRKGWAINMRDAMTDRSKTAVGVLPPDLRKPIGFTRVNSIATSNLLFQFAIVGAVFFFGRLLVRRLINPILAGTVIIPDYIGGIIGAFIVWPILCKLKLDEYVDRASVQSIAGMLVDVLLVGAMATLNLHLIATYWVPILLLSVAGTLITIVMTYGFCYLICKDEWFEKATYLFGLGTGVAATGMALLRIVDPENKTSVYEIRGVGSALIAPLNNVMLPTVMVPLAYSCGGMDALVGLCITLAFVIVGVLLFHKSAKNRSAAN